MSETVLRSLERGVLKLEAAGVPEARLCTELLLAHVLTKPRYALFMDLNEMLMPSTRSQFEGLLNKRAERYPLQYLVETAPFRQITLQVGAGCLIPRPETETLVQVVLDRAKRDSESVSVLDIGTGSGNIALSLASERPHWFITGTDYSKEALCYAQLNAERNGVSDRVRWFETDLWSGVPHQKFDMIVSNPPYLTDVECSHLEPELQFEPHAALNGGCDGLDFFRRIIKDARSVLKKHGLVFFEVGMGQADSVSKIFTENGFQSVEIVRDHSGIERIVSAQDVDHG